MEKRRLGKTGLDVSILGFGCMRFPSTDGKSFTPNVIEKETVDMIRHAIDNGVNYIDTAYIYHSGVSEVVVGKALQDGYREKVILATKSPVFTMKTEDDFDRILDEQLKRLDTNTIDCYLIHAIDRTTWESVVLKFNLIEKAEKAKRAGKIKHIGFSFHDDLALFKTIIDHYDGWEFCQIQLNYMNEEYQAGLEGFNYAVSKGLGVIAMEPLLGGRLANVSKEVLKVFNAIYPEKTAAEWAFDYLYDKSDIATVLSGMSSMEQVVQNIASAKRASKNMLSDMYREVYKTVFKKINETTGVPCTQCAYCMPCPVGVDIPRNFEIFNELFRFDTPMFAQSAYDDFKRQANGKGISKSCVECGECVPKCPQAIDIPCMLKKVTESLWKI